MYCVVYPPCTPLLKLELYYILYHTVSYYIHLSLLYSPSCALPSFYLSVIVLCWASDVYLPHPKLFTLTPSHVTTNTEKHIHPPFTSFVLLLPLLLFSSRHCCSNITTLLFVLNALFTAGIKIRDLIKRLKLETLGS